MGRAGHPHLGGPHVEGPPSPRETTRHSRGRTAATSHATRSEGGPPTQNGEETHPNRDPQQQPHHTAPTPPHRHTPAEVTTATTPDGTGPLARPQTQSGRDRKPAEAQTAQSSPDTATGPQTESTQQEEAVASRVKQQPTRERLTGGPVAHASRPRARRSKRQTQTNQQKGEPPLITRPSQGGRKNNASLLILLVRSQSSL